jgi:hypothetical protein
VGALFHQPFLGQSWGAYLVAYEVERVLSKVEQALSFSGKLVHFSRAFVAHVPFAFDVALLFQRTQKRINRAWAEVHSEGSAYFCDYLVAVHG